LHSPVYLIEEVTLSVLNKIAFYQGRRDEVPNQETARILAETRNTDDIREIAENLWNKEPNIQSDCLKVLYELGYLAPELIADYVDDFIRLLRNRNNRMVWGGMIALSTIAGLQADKIFPHVDEIIQTMDAGSIITNDAGIKTLTEIAARKIEYHHRIVPFLLERLANSRPVDAPRYAENIFKAIRNVDKAEFIKILEKWIGAASGSRLTRLKKVCKQAKEIT
jgi:tRNA isopentenyl-2-thiomethyl-A-37 hydroxylase MiaE